MIDFQTFLGELYCGSGDAGADARTRTPWRWQARLATWLADREREPPDVIAVPTGAGKTTTIDALVWALAAQADAPAACRTVGVRLVWAIDRRILVDEVHRHARQMADRLDRARRDAADPLHDVAARLCRIGGSEVPLAVTRWRGGLAELHERHSPLQPEIITSTVAQIGSRLLFRGYGVGEGSLALEAGLAGCDTTICLDEAHLAEPFRQTVDQIRAHRRAEPAQLPGLRAITITATPTPGHAGAMFGLTDEERAELGIRLTGEKVATLDDRASEKDADQEAALLAAVDAHLEDGARTVACVANSVRTARAVFDQLLRRDDAIDALLLIGPQRPADREERLGRFRSVLFDGQQPERPLVCVATQTFEVGLDADVDALVTQSASASSLVQRLGRLNRRGTRAGRATIVRHEGFPLYADDEPRAWSWLRELDRDGEVDVSVAALDAAPKPPPVRSSHAPSLTGEVVELLAQTSPRPARWADPDVEPFLRGVESEPGADVALCWRCDLRLDRDEGDADRYREALLRLVPPRAEEKLTLSLAAARALLAARFGSGTDRAASRRMALAEVDVEGAQALVGDARVPEVDGIPFLVLRGAELRRGTLARGDVADRARAEPPITPGGLLPGDVVVLATERGGTDEHGLAPAADRATDVAADVRPSAAVAPTPVRLTGEALEVALRSIEQHDRVAAKILRRAAHADRRLLRAGTGGERSRALEPLLTALADVAAAAGLTADSVILRRVDPENDDLLADEAEADASLLDRDAGGLLDTGESEDEFADELLDGPRPGDASLLKGERAWLEPAWVLLPRPVVTADEVRDRDRPPTIAAHAGAVAARASAFASGLRLPPNIADAVALAAKAHDHGKGDRRFQAFFRGGVAGPLGEPLAKSTFGTADRRADQAARKAAGLPRRLRHEIASVAILADALQRGAVPAIADDTDRELALHLVATHHGRGRPWPTTPVVDASSALPSAFHVDVEGVAGTAIGDGSDGWQDGAWLRRFFSVLGRYGPWGAAYLEAVLMLADRTVSAEGR